MLKPDIQVCPHTSCLKCRFSVQRLHDDFTRRPGESDSVNDNTEVEVTSQGEANSTEYNWFVKQGISVKIYIESPLLMTSNLKYHWQLENHDPE